MKTGVIIGRFQVPELHPGHKHLIDSVLAKSDECVILIGDTGTKDDRNPYTFGFRAAMIAEAYPQVYFKVLPDRGSDEEWSKLVDSTLLFMQSPTLYGSRDSFICQYKGVFNCEYIDELPGYSGTQVREQLKYLK